ncbi:hypothetical protein C8F01DRAFT_1109717 [Mycena amicta]|nr:hypothetical protein C8F01DRAFT_1109717 [Mycena amicta]
MKRVRSTQRSDAPVVFDDDPPLKRPRIVPPSLDGQQRSATHRYDLEDGEEDDLDASADGGPQSVALNTEYQQANTVLHELHVLHQHRLIFASPPPRHFDKSFYQEPASKLEGGREAVGVKHRYEESNKTLGNLFLNRRRELEHS